MDIISHAIIGWIIGLLWDATPREMAVVVLFSILPDLFQVPLYAVAGKDRRFWIPRHEDWRGFRVRHPAWTLLWEIPHSMLFLLIIGSLMLAFKLPLLALVGYSIHLAIDLFTHRGEWSVKPLFPHSYTMEGFTDAWRWSGGRMAIAWVVLGAGAYTAYLVT